MVEFVKVWRAQTVNLNERAQGYELFQGVRNITLTFEDKTATKYSLKCFENVHQNNQCLRNLRSITLLPSPNMHSSQYEILKMILEANLSTVTKVRLDTSQSLHTLAEVGLERLTQFKALEL